MLVTMSLTMLALIGASPVTTPMYSVTD